MYCWSQSHTQDCTLNKRFGYWTSRLQNTKLQAIKFWWCLFLLIGMCQWTQWSSALSLSPLLESSRSSRSGLLKQWRKWCWWEKLPRYFWTKEKVKSSIYSTLLKQPETRKTRLVIRWSSWIACMYICHGNGVDPLIFSCIQLVDHNLLWLIEALGVQLTSIFNSQAPSWLVGLHYYLYSKQ